RLTDRIAEALSQVRVAFEADSVLPPLSSAERALLPDGKPAWSMGRRRWHIGMGSDFQQRAERTGGLVAAGTSGSLWRLMLQAVRMRDVWGVDADLGWVQLGYTGQMLFVQH
ncbi:hypothetical protein, partial [Streptomyces sp. GSL17-113]|uniref:hypothetical protein n=1 Tax=Streptomyces sp. GSL17-113 TaxID=3115365 RepID=UPI002E76501F